MSELLKQVAPAIPGIAKLLINERVNHYCEVAPARPHRFSLWSAAPPPAPGGTEACGTYTAWPSLTDRGWTARHLGPDTIPRAQPDMATVERLYRRDGPMRSGRASALFAFFAQWFTDSFLRTLPGDRRRTDSNHEIDLCQIYGLDERTTRALREGQGGRLKLRRGADGRRYPPLLYQGRAIDPAYADLGYLRPEARVANGAAELIDHVAIFETRLGKVFPPGVVSPIDDPARRLHLYALGLERGGSTIVYSALNTIFLREHNNIAGLLEAENPGWDDERLFQTARLINVRQFLTVIMEDYIGFIADLPIVLDRSFAERKPWYRTNRTSIEFNILYRFHGLTPETIELGGRSLGHLDYRFNNALLEEHGVGAVVTGASNTPAGAVELMNSPAFLIEAEKAAVRFARDFKLRPFNHYRRRFGMAPYRSIAALTGGAPWTAALEAAYGGDVNAVEYPIGLLAEGRGHGELFGETLMTMVAHDAFTHILTNPVLCEEVHCAEVFTDAGLAYIEETFTLPQIVQRACEDEGDVLTCFTSPNWPGAAEVTQSPLG